MKAANWKITTVRPDKVANIAGNKKVQVQKHLFNVNHMRIHFKNKTGERI